jgi:DNA-binding Lrp family transcriptional regulator
VNETYPIDTIDRELLQWLQDEFSVERRPWKSGARKLGVSEQEVLARVQRLVAEGIIRNLHAFINNKKLRSGRSTLVAMMVPDGDIDRIATIINEYPEVTHNYRRNHAYNIWFTISERDEHTLSRTFEELKKRTGISDSAILDLRTIRVFKVDVRFWLTGTGNGPAVSQKEITPGYPPIDEIDRTLLRITQEGIPLVTEPFKRIAREVDIHQDEVIQRLDNLYKSGIIKRIGASINQRKLGIVANALVAWKIPCGLTEDVGTRLSSFPEVTHCYERSTVPGMWDYNVFTVLHGYDHQTVEELVKRLSDAIGIRDYVILFSTKQYKRTSIIHEVPREYSPFTST